MPKPNPFTPKSGWGPKIFAGRKDEFEFLDKKLEEARNGRSDHFLVLGEWGIGKTSVLKEFKRIAQEKGFISSLITVREFRKTEDLTDAVEHLVETIPSKLPLDLKKLKKFASQIDSLGIQVLGTGFQLSRATERTDPQTFLLRCLHVLWEDLKDETDVLLVLLDDVQNFDRVSEIFTLIKNVLSDEEIVKTGYLFAISCTPEGWSKFMQLHHPIGRYFTPRLTLKRLSGEECYQVIDRTLEETGVVFEENIKDKVYEYTEGHPYELQVLCSNLYDTGIKGRVTLDQWSPALNETLLNLGEMVWDVMYNGASEQERKVLYAVASLDKPSSRKEITNFIEVCNLGLSGNVVGVLLGRLLEKGLLAKPDKYQYGLVDKLFMEYILRHRGYDGSGAVPG